MIDPNRKTSTVTKGIMKLNNLKSINGTQDSCKLQLQTNNLMNFHRPDPESDIKKYQYQMISTEEVMLSNAECNLKNMLTMFVDNIDEENKDDLLPDNLKKFRESQILSEAIEEEIKCVGSRSNHPRRKTKNYPNTLNTNTILNATGNTVNNTMININSNQLSTTAALGKKFMESIKENNNNSSSSSIIGKNKNNFLKKGSDNHIMHNNIVNDIALNKTEHNYKVNFDNNGVKQWDRTKFKTNGGSGKILKKNSNKKKLKTSTDIPSFIPIPSNNGNGSIPISLPSQEKDKVNKMQNTRRMSIPIAMINHDIDNFGKQLFNQTLNEDLTYNLNRHLDIDNQNTKINLMDDGNDDDFFDRPKTYSILHKRSRKDPNSKDKETNCSFHRFKSRDSRRHSIIIPTESVDMRKMQGYSIEHQDKLTQMVVEMKNNIAAQKDSSVIIPKENHPTNAIEAEIKHKVDSSDEKTFFLLNNSTLNSTMRLQEKFRQLTRKGYVYDSLDDEEIDDEIEGVFNINPNSIGYIIYQMVMFLAVIYCLTYTPFSLAHDLRSGKATPIWKKSIDVIIDGLFILDIFIQFFVSYQTFDETLITSNGEIAMHYLNNWFFLDLITGMPLNTFILYGKGSDMAEIPLYYNAITKRLIEIISLIKILKSFGMYFNNMFMKGIHKYLIEFEHFNRWSKVYLSLILLLLSIHLLACVFIFLGQTDYPNWIIAKSLDIADFGTIYTASIYYILSSVFTIGYGDITSINRAERLFNLFVLVVGIMVYSWALSSISTYIQTKDSKTVEYKKKCDILEEIRLTHEKMPFDLYDKIQRYLKYRVMHEKKDKNVIFETLPITLRNNLIYEMYKPVIDNFIFFKTFHNNDFIVKVILAFKPILGLKNDILVKEGEYFEEIIFVKKGNLSLEIPLPIAISAESLKQSHSTLTKTKTLLNASTLNKKKTLYAFDSTHIYNNDDNDIFKKHGSLNMDPTMKRTRTKIEPIFVRQYVKILEIRKNEHFGDTLMFLNCRSPLCVKVKSKYSEMFFLSRTDAINIADTYPIIWRSITKKSLFNMEQIERLINKALKLFFESNEGQRNVNSPGNIMESIINPKIFGKNRSSEFPKTPDEIKQLFENKNNCELKSIPSCRSIIAEENDEDDDNADDEDYEFHGHPKQINNDDISIEIDDETHKSPINKNDQIPIIKEEEDSDTQSTVRVNIENKSVVISDRGNTEDDKMSFEANINYKSIKSSNSKYNKKSNLPTPFRLSDINTEIYPNEEQLNSVYYSKDNEKYDSSIAPHNGALYSSDRSSMIKDNNIDDSKSLSKKHSPFIGEEYKLLQNSDSNPKRIESCKENSSSYTNSNTNNAFISNQFKTIKVSPTNISQNFTKNKNNNQGYNYNTTEDYNNEKSGHKVYLIACCTNNSFTIASEYKNLNEMNNHNITTTKGLIAAILSLNISDIEKALKKCSFGLSLKTHKRSSVSLTIISKPDSFDRNAVLINPLLKQNTSLNLIEDLKNTQLSSSPTTTKKRISKCNSINVMKGIFTGSLMQKESSIEDQNPMMRNRMSIAQFNQTKEDYVNKKTEYSSRNSKANIGNVGGIGDSCLSPAKKVLTNPYKHTKSLFPSPQKEKNLLNVISKNMEENSLQLNNNSYYYSIFFKDMIDKENNNKEQIKLLKRLKDTEKLVKVTAKNDHKT